MRKYIITSMLMAFSFVCGAVGPDMIDFFSVRKFPAPEKITTGNFSFRYFHNVERDGKRLPQDVEGARRELSRLLVGMKAEDVGIFFSREKTTDAFMKGPRATRRYQDYIYDCRKRLVKVFVQEGFGKFDVGVEQWSVAMTYDDKDKVTDLVVDATVVVK